MLDNSDLTPDQEKELESNLVEAETISIESLPDPAESSMTGLESLSVQQLEDLNSDLQAENEEISQQIQDTKQKIEAYEQDFSNSDSQSKSKVTQLEEYTNTILKQQIEAENEKKLKEKALKNEQDDEQDEEDDKDLSISAIFVVSIGFGFLMLHGIRTLIGFSIQSFLNPAFYSLFVDVTVLLVILALASLAYYSDFYDPDALEFSLLIIGLSVFTFFWLFLGLWFIVAAQSFSRTWIRHEKSCQDLRNLTHIFQEAQIEIENGSVPRRLKAIYKDFQYAIMRQLFISPTFLPPVTETYLRTDFNLSEYLSRCISDVICKVFQINWLGYSFVGLSMVAWRAIIVASHDVQVVILWIIPVLLIFVSVVVISKLQGIYNKLVPQPTDQIVLNLPRDNFGRSPDMNENIIPKPKYLAGQFYSNDREAHFINCCFVKTHPLKLTWSYIFNKTYPNRHEILFWCDKYGVDLIISLVQGLSVIVTLWVTVVLLYYIPILHDEWDTSGIFMIIGSVFIYAFIACYLLPEIIRLVTLTSKIEMKKDKNIINDVILHDRIEKAKTMARLYRQFKMIYRQKYGENPKVSDKVLEDFAEEIFNFYKDPISQVVDIEDLEDMVALCGLKLEDDELRLFAKECKVINQREITLDGFKIAISVLMASRSLRPEFVTKVVFTKHFQENRGKKVKDASLEEVKQFFNDFYWHFQEEDIQDFLWETRFVLEDIGTVNITELSGMVSNNVKDFPR